jgi:hypothetical protein
MWPSDPVSRLGVVGGIEGLRGLPADLRVGGLAELRAPAAVVGELRLYPVETIEETHPQ